ncbi:aldehyde dehydrogenase family protein [Bacillus sp. T33-2]|uniref:aldehyde dehydrogenase family protein n=1 Tax=Bacillus sp. T33-2 TaxID=2054168 RepID=UPI000C75FC9F|nr:aldehyde dehydrogenase family protein [Bacillus sp. T33-2]PLR97707.1 aldehyde dehydrogenase [Bacillus sp. T33-2]
MNKFIEVTNQFIDGEWKEGTSKKKGTILNPFNNEVIAEVALASKEDVNSAFLIANKAQKEWEKTSAEEKIAVLHRAAKFMEDHSEEIVDIMVQESGSTVGKAQFELYATLQAFKEAATYPKRMEPVVSPSNETPGKVNHVIRKPIGVVSSISPFNFSLFLSIRTIVPAIAAGNAVVHKPDLQTAMSGGTVIAKAFEEAGLPAGIFNLIIADIAEIGDAMVDNPAANFVSFTGSTAVGRHIGAVAGRNLKRVALELGGNSPFLVLEDADVDQAVNAAVFGKFLHCGQICMIVNRILVHRSVHDEFVKKFVAKASGLSYGNPADPTVVIGPLINERQIEKVLNFAKMAEDEGATVALRGKRDGNVVTPFVFTDVKNNGGISQCEIFGPIATIISFETEEEGIRLANETEYGLSAGIFTKDLARGVAVAQQIESGMAHVNDQSVHVEAEMPFGGEKGSGLGRFGGQWSLEEFTTVQWVTVQEGNKVYPF